MKNIRADKLDQRSAAFWTIVDQAIASAGNFLLSLVLARHLQPPEFAVFALVFLSIMAFNTLHGGLVVYWMNVVGAKCDSVRIRVLLTSALTITAALPLVYLPIVWAIVHTLGKVNLFGWVLVATLAWQLQETTRRALLCQFRSIAAIAGDAISYGGQIGIVLLLHVSDVSSVLKIVAATSACAAILQGFQTGLAPIHAADAWTTFRESLKSTKYSVGGNFMNMLALQVPSWLLLHARGKWDVACYQALLSIMNAANPILFTVSNFIIPAVARVADGSVNRARSVASIASLQISSPLLLFFVAVIAAPGLVLAVAYGKSSPYLLEADLLRVFAIAVFFQWIATCIGAYEAGLGRTKHYFLSQSLSLISLVSVGMYLIFKYGVLGAVESAILASSIRALVTWWMSQRNSRLTQVLVQAQS